MKKILPEIKAGVFLHDKGVKKLKPKLTATDGHYLTDGEIYTKEVYLGVNDSPDNWHEITAEEYEQIQAEEQARMEAELQTM